MTSADYSSNQPDSKRSPDGGQQEKRSVEPGRLLPLEATGEPWGGPWGANWSVRLPLRAEQISIEKQTVVIENVVVRRRLQREVVLQDDAVRRERLRLETRGALTTRRGRSDREQIVKVKE